MSNTKTIFISAYRNFSIRYILYSDILKELKDRDYKIVIFAKDNDLDYYRDKLEDRNVTFEPVYYDEALEVLKSNRISRFFVLIRKCMSGGTDSYENTTDKVRFYQYGKQASGNILRSLEFRAIKLLATAGRKMFFIRKAIVAVESFLFPGRMYDGYFNKYNPEMLIISSLGYMIDPYFMRAARRHKCKVVSIIHNWDNPTTKDYRGADPDHVIAWNDIMKREVSVFHDIPKEKIYVGGIAHWDFYFNGSFKPGPKDEFLKSHGLSKERKIIFYGTSSWVNFHNTFDVIEKLLEKIQQDDFICPVQLLVRLHPMYLLKQRGKKGQIIDQFRDRIESTKEKYGNLVSFNMPMMKVLNDDIDMPVEDMYNLAEILHYSNMLLTEYSTLMIEGAIFDLPVVNVSLYNYRNTDKPASLFEEYTHIKRVLKTGACKNAYSHEQLLEYINYYLADSSRDKEKRAAMVRQEITVNKGHAGEKIADYILDLISKN